MTAPKGGRGRRSIKKQNYGDYPEETTKKVAEVAEEDDFSNRRSSRRGANTRTRSTYADEEVTAVAEEVQASRGTKTKTQTPGGKAPKKRKRRDVITFFFVMVDRTFTYQCASFGIKL